MDSDISTPEKQRTKVFISYSRKDSDFCQRLAHALTNHGYAVVYDQSSLDHGDPDARLSAQNEWWKQLQTMIALCEVMIFVVSPHSAASNICDDEIAFARRLGKRVVAVLYEPIDFNMAPERLRSLSVKLDFTDATRFGNALDELTKELAHDIEWYRSGARLSRLAQQWHAEGFPEGQLLRMAAIDSADAWAHRRPSDAPSPGDLLLEFLEASRRKERADEENRRRIIGRAFVKPSAQSFAEGRLGAGLRYAAAGMLLSGDFRTELVPELDSSFRQAAFFDRTVTILQGPAEAVFSPDGRLVVTTRDKDNFSPCVWDATNGTHLGMLQGHVDWVRTAAFSPDGADVATASADGTVRVWDITTHTQKFCLIGHSAHVYTAKFSPDGRNIVSASGDGTARVWDAKTGKEIVRFKGHRAEVTGAEFLCDNQTVITTSEDSTVRLWDVAMECEIARMTAHEQETLAALSADKTLIATVAKDNILDRKICIWDGRSGQQVNQFACEHGGFRAISFHPDGTRLVTATATQASVWDIETGECLFDLEGHTDGLLAAAFSPNGQYIVTGSEDESAMLWDASEGKPIHVYKEHEGNVLTVAFSPDSARVATGSLGQTVCLWNCSTDNRIAALKSRDDSNIQSVLFMADNRHLLVTGRSIRQWDTVACKENYAVEVEEGVSLTVLSPDGTKILTLPYASTSAVRSYNTSASLWDAATGQHLYSFATTFKHGWGMARKKARGACFSHDGQYVALPSPDCAARVWSCADGMERGCIRAEDDQIQSILLSCHGKELITVGGTLARIWDVARGNEMGRLEESEPLHGAAFSPDGSRMLLIGEGWASLWDWHERRKIATLPRHANGTLVAAFSPDGSRIVTICGYVGIIWDGRVGEPILRLRGSVVGERIAFSAGSDRIATKCPGSTGARAAIWSARTGALIAPIDAESGVGDVDMSPDGMRLATGSQDSITRLWDVSRSVAVCGDPAEALASILSLGHGLLTASESRDLLMQMAPADLSSALLAHLSPETRDMVDEHALALRRPLAPPCYVAPSHRPTVGSTNFFTVEGLEEEFKSWDKQKERRRWTSYDHENEDLADEESSSQDEATELLAASIGEDDPQTYTAMNNLAVLAQKRGEFDVANQLLERVLAGKVRLLGENHQDTRMALSNLIGNEHERGNRAAVVMHLQYLLEITRMSLGDDNPETINVLQMLGRIHEIGKDANKAFQYYAEASQVLERTCGPEHADTLNSLRQVAGVLFDQGRYDDTLALIGDIRERLIKSVGEEQPETYSSLQEIGQVLCVKGDYPRATSTLDMVLEWRIEHDGVTSPTTVKTLAWLIKTKARSGDIASVEVLRERFLDIARVPKNDDCGTTAVIDRLSEALRTAAEPGIARDLWKRTLDMYVQEFGPKHAETQAVTSRLASAHVECGEYIEAQTMLQTMLDSAKLRHGRDHKDTIICEYNLAYVMYLQGDLTKAFPLQETVLESATRVLGPIDEVTLDTKYCLADTYFALGAVDKALDMHKDVLTLRQKTFGPGSGPVRRSRSRLAELSAARSQ